MLHLDRTHDPRKNADLLATNNTKSTTDQKEDTKNRATVQASLSETHSCCAYQSF